MKRMLFLLLIIILILCIVNVYAETKNIELTEITTEDKSNTITVEEPIISEREVTSNITFNSINDYVEFKLTLENKETEKLKITDISDNLENDNM